MFVINPEPYSVPSYRIGPFRTKDIAFNNKLKDDDSIDAYFKERFNGRKFLYCTNGRSALNKALSHYGLKKEDVVTILTTTGNFYIAKCVTTEIEKFCRWSRQIEKETKVLLVNHEFGYPYPELGKLKELGIPIIEDCAHAFFSNDKEGSIGNVGDFIIFSFVKMFPIQIGGLLVCNKPGDYGSDPAGREEVRYMKNVLSHHIGSRDQMIRKRLKNYRILRKNLSKLGFGERFPLEEGVVPGVYMFRKDDVDADLPKLKEYLWAHGIQSSLLYKEDSFFLPVHQCLNSSDLKYFVEVTKTFLSLCK